MDLLRKLNNKWISLPNGLDSEIDDNEKLLDGSNTNRNPDNVERQTTHLKQRFHVNMGWMILTGVNIFILFLIFILNMGRWEVDDETACIKKVSPYCKCVFTTM
jgi:hypothetical protein